jgi:hypothetical protein
MSSHRAGQGEAMLILKGRVFLSIHSIRRNRAKNAPAGRLLSRNQGIGNRFLNPDEPVRFSGLYCARHSAVLPAARMPSTVHPAARIAHRSRLTPLPLPKGRDSTAQTNRGSLRAVESLPRRTGGEGGSESEHSTFDVRRSMFDVSFNLNHPPAPFSRSEGHLQKNAERRTSNAER